MGQTAARRAGGRGLRPRPHRSRCRRSDSPVARACQSIHPRRPSFAPFPLVLSSREGWGCWMAASRGRARLRTGRAGRQHGISRRGEAPTTAGTCWPDDKRSLGAVRSALWVPRPGAMSPFCSRAPSRPLPHVILSPTISRIRCPPNRLVSIPAAPTKREESRRLAVSTPS